MYQIRKLEKYSVIRHSETAFLDPDDFRQYGYSGETEQEFLEFIENFDLDLLVFLSQKCKNHNFIIFT